MALSASAADIETSATGDLNLDAFKGRTLHVEFDSSSKLSAELRERFQALGFTLAQEKADAEVSVKVMAGYFFQKPRAKQQYIDFGAVVEQASKADIDRKADESTRVAGVELAPLVQGLRQNLSANMVLGVGLVDSVLSLSGARGWFNKLVSGDERGVCLGTAEMCKDWKKYVQRMRIAAFITPKHGDQAVIRAEASAKDEELVPDELFRASMGSLTGRLFPRPVNAQDQSAQGAVQGAGRTLSDAAVKGASE